MTPLLSTDTERSAQQADRLGPAELAIPQDLDTIPNQPRWPARLSQLVRSYPRPFGMLGLLLISFALDLYIDGLGDPLALVVIAIGGIPLLRDTVIAIRQKRYALDYLALLAIAAAIVALEFQVGAVICRRLPK